MDVDYNKKYSILEINGGWVDRGGQGWRLGIPEGQGVYMNGQIYDYEGGRSSFRWEAGVEMVLEARFSFGEDEGVGTAGFGFWNAPFGDKEVGWPALPRAVWFFFGGEGNDFPLRRWGAGRGWFVSTVDAGRPRAWSLAPWAPVVVIGNRWGWWRERVWPWVQRQLGMSFQLVGDDMREWHRYRLQWGREGCRFWCDERLLLETKQSPQGKLGFVCWVDNQYLQVTATGGLGWGVSEVGERGQWLEIKGLQIGQIGTL
ncbi:MAG TPA: hypothetical protein VLL52_13500 [Anaerolineae bacterium]|nr:hypothetical protein [Anaerolineae bacterium]